jgi:murein DD-endopeptidase MepM/ murein hydrolase activator NlpD
MVQLAREPRYRNKGVDVTAMKRVTHHILGIEKPLSPSPEARRTFQLEWTVKVNRALRKAGLPQRGAFTQRLYNWAKPRGHVDGYSDFLFEQYAKAHPVLTIVYPLASSHAYTCQGLHETAGLLGNWALDFCASPNVNIVAPEGGVIQKLSGRHPSDDTGDAFGIYGWSVYLRTPVGYVYYLTHLGWRANLQVGQRVGVGQLLGKVGDQQFRPDHLHCGVTSPLGERDARHRIEAVARAQRLVGV